MRSTFVCITALALTACGPTQEEQQAAAEAAAAYHLLDPSSAQFREVEFRDEDTVCGQINGKNRMGAYSGFTNFVSYRTPSGEWLAEIVTTSSFAQDLYSTLCIVEEEPVPDADPRPDAQMESQADPAEAPIEGSTSNPQNDSPAEASCVGQWGLGDDYFYLDYAAKEVNFIQMDTEDFSARYRVKGMEIRYEAGGEEFAITCNGSTATDTNLVTGRTRTFEALRN
ncbi:MAG: hypothetical protein H6919_03350 [Sphingomonadaceae bacterium]|nr:hypothetical protein [Altererythrobacter sp.]MCP5392936.1 hypothetical protein [Sphingomonadaceae bacterium]